MMTGRQQQPYRAPPEIRGLLPPGPVRSGQIPLEPWKNNVQAQVGRPFGRFPGNDWRVMMGHDPQDISGALDGNDLIAGVEKGIEYNFNMKVCENNSHELILTGDYVFAFRNIGQKTGSALIQDVGCLNVLLRTGYEEDLLRFKEAEQSHRQSREPIEALSEKELFGERYYEKWKKADPEAYLRPGSMTSIGLLSTYGGAGGEALVDVIDGVVQTALGGDPYDDDGEFTSANRPSITANKNSDLQNDNDRLVAYLKRGKTATELARTRVVLNEELEMTQDRILRAFLLKKTLEDQKILKMESSIRFRSLDFWKKRMGKSTEGLNYLYVGSIMDFWNPLGVVRSSTNDSGFENRRVNNAPNTRLRGPALAVTTCKKSQQFNNLYKNELALYDKLYLILKRVEEPSGSGYWGPIQILPWSNGRQSPSPEDLYYEDFSGEPATGVCLHVGCLSEGLRGETRPHQKRTQACGLNRLSSPKDTFDAKVGLDKLVIHVGLGESSIKCL